MQLKVYKPMRDASAPDQPATSILPMDHWGDYIIIPANWFRKSINIKNWGKVWRMLPFPRPPSSWQNFHERNPSPPLSYSSIIRQDLYYDLLTSAFRRLFRIINFSGFQTRTFSIFVNSL